MEVIHQEDHPNKKVYTITDKGREDLQKWIAKPLEIQRFRNEMLVQITLADRLEDEQILSMLEQYIQKVRAMLSALEGDDVRGIMSLARSNRERFLWQAALGKGILTTKNELRWAEKILADFKQEFVD